MPQSIGGSLFLQSLATILHQSQSPQTEPQSSYPDKYQR